MPNVFKFNTSTDEKSLRKGNFSIGVGDVPKGPSSVTGFYQGITPHVDGWMIYKKIDGDTLPFRIYSATQGSLVNIVNIIEGKTFSQIWECLNHYALTSSSVIVNKDFPPIVTDGLILMVDPSNTISYPSTGSTLYDLSGNNYNASLINSPVHNSDSFFSFDGFNSYASFDYIGLRLPPTTDRTLEIWAKVNNYPASQGGLIAGQKNTTGALMVLANGRFSWYWDDSLGVQSTTTLTLNTWYQIVIILRNSYYCTYYVNGKLDKEEFQTSDTSSGQVTVWTIGRQNRDFSGDFYYLDCDVSIHRQYSKNLSESEIIQNYYGSSIVTDGLVYALDPGNLVSYDMIGLTAYSLIGNFTASLVNGTTFSKNFGGVFDFAGQDEFIELPYDPYWNGNVFGTATNFTLECWYKPDVFENWDTIIEKAQTPGWYSASEGPAIWTNSNSIQGVFSSGVSGNPAGSLVILSYTTTLLRWYHIAFTGDGTTLRLYVDGIQRATGSVASRTISVTNGNVGPRFGRRNYMDGQLGSARFYNRHLTPSEVLNNYGATNWRFGL